MSPRRFDADQVLEDLIGYATVTTLASANGVILMAIYTPQEKPTFRVWKGDKSVEFDDLTEAAMYAERIQ